MRRYHCVLRQLWEGLKGFLGDKWEEPTVQFTIHPTKIALDGRSLSEFGNIYLTRFSSGTFIDILWRQSWFHTYYLVLINQYTIKQISPISKWHNLSSNFHLLISPGRIFKWTCSNRPFTSHIRTIWSSISPWSKEMVQAYRAGMYWQSN